MVEPFQPCEPLFPGGANPHCRAIVIVPARDEEGSLVATLDALAAQVGLDGRRLPRNFYEVFLLLNNCTDRSAEVASAWQKNNPRLRLHVADQDFAGDKAFVGTARRMLMDTAWHWLEDRPGVCAILSTDSDTVVRQDWVVRNFTALEAGADAVGGVITLKEGELHQLPPAVRRAYLRDCRYQRLVAELEDRLDPQDGDPWPRHLQHFGASLACTPQIYAKAGGMPAVTPLEDVAFVDRLRRVSAKLRHHGDVVVYTSARMKGRVDVGLSGQLLLWQRMSDQKDVHRVQSAAWLAHRFRTLRHLRKEALQKGVAGAEYLAEVDCDSRAEETFRGRGEGEITQVNRRLAAMLARPDNRQHERGPIFA